MSRRDQFYFDRSGKAAEDPQRVICQRNPGTFHSLIFIVQNTKKDLLQLCIECKRSFLLPDESRPAKPPDADYFFLLSAVEIGFDQFKDLGLISADILTEGAVIEFLQ